MKSTKKKSGGLSFRSDDAIETGLFASGPAGLKGAEWANFDYGGSSKPVPVLLVTFTREGEENYEQPYSIGKGWKIKDGELLALNGQSGLPKSCNAMRHLIKPLEKALEASGAPDDFMDNFPDSLGELSEIVVARVVQESRDIKGSKKNATAKPKDEAKERTILEIEEITGAPWVKASGKKKAKAKPEADDDDDTEADDDEDEKPAKGKGKAKPAADDDDDEDEDEAPAKGKKKPAITDDDEAEGDDGLTEEGIEALVSALEANDGKLTEDDLEDALMAVLKKNKQAKAIVKLMTSDDGLELEKGWSYNAKKGTIIAD